MTAWQDDPQEQESVELLTAMMGDNAPGPDVVLRVLRKHGGDVQKAATAILEGDHAEEPRRHPSPARMSEIKPYSAPSEFW